MSESMHFAVSSSQHRVLGKQIRLQLGDDFVLRLTPAEASSLSFALVAVRNGSSQEREIYMSPIASDDGFVGIVRESGMSIDVRNGLLELDWQSVEKLSEELAAAI